MTIRFLKLSLASPESIRSWTERTLSNGNKVGKILKGDLIDYKNGLPIRDGLNCERIFGPVVSFTCSCGRFKCFETRGIHIIHDYGITTRFDKVVKTNPTKKSESSLTEQKKDLEMILLQNYFNIFLRNPKFCFPVPTKKTHVLSSLVQKFSKKIGKLGNNDFIFSLFQNFFYSKEIFKIWGLPSSLKYLPIETAYKVKKG
nr:hypothetical protein [Trentepohlia sp. YN1317]